MEIWPLSMLIKNMVTFHDLVACTVCRCAVLLPCRYRETYAGGTDSWATRWAIYTAIQVTNSFCWCFISVTEVLPVSFDHWLHLHPCPTSWTKKFELRVHFALNKYQSSKQLWLDPSIVVSLFLLCTVYITTTYLYLHLFRYCIFNLLSSCLTTQPHACNKLSVSVRYY